MRKLRHITAAFVVSILVLSLIPDYGNAQPQASEEEQILFTADEVSHDRELGITKASGNVEVSRGKRILIADKISYNQGQNILSASGNVSLLEPTGEVLFAEFIEITSDFKDGILKQLRIRLSDNARIAAAGARRSGGTILEMRNAVYSPCENCGHKDKDGPPLWQVKAKKIVHDQPNQIIEYSDAWLEIDGNPVFYTPYFSHPDPTVKRKSGFLTPGFQASTYLGTSLSTPYFFAISPSKDLTFTPTITSKQRVLLAGEYRQRLSKSETNGIASITYNANNEVRGHLDVKARFDRDSKWRWGLDLKRAADDTYLRRYGFTSQSTLTSRLFAEGFSKRNYLSIDAYVFQGLQVSDSPGQTPIVLPMIEYSRLSEPGRWGAQTSFNAHALALTRTDGTDTRRISLSGGWKLPHIGPLGDVTNFTVSARGDLYHRTNMAIPGSTGTDSGFTGRVVPEARLDWRLPLARQHGTVSQVIEPVASTIVSPYGGNPSDIPNEDSIELEFDETNLFNSSRFSGHDRVEGGPRVNYGLKWGLFGAKGGSTTAFVGQSYRLKKDDTFAQDSGLEDHFSDFVGRVNITPGKNIDLMYRTRIDKSNFSPKRNEIQMKAGPPALRLSTNYIFFQRQDGSEFSGREELSGEINAKLDRFWLTKFSGRYDANKNDLRSIGINFTYECECFVFSASIKRDFYEDRDIRPNDTFLLKLTFKTLGDVKTGISSFGG